MFATVLLFGCVVIVTCQPVDLPWPSLVVKTRHLQCYHRGYDGTCGYASNGRPITLSCKVLMCAKLKSDGTFVMREVQQFAPDEGTKCGKYKICKSEICTTQRKSMPIFVGPEESYRCSRK